MDEAQALDPDEPAPRRVSAARRICVGVLASAALVLLLVADGYSPLGLVYAICGVAVVGIALAEYGRLAAMAGMAPHRGVLVGGGMAVFAVHWAAWAVGVPLPTPWTLAAGAVVAVVLAALCVRTLPGRIDGALQEAAATAFGVAYIALPMACLTSVRMGWGTGGLLTVLVVTKGGSSGAYFAGKTIGRHKLAPRVSPNKTVEGAFGAVAACVALAVAMSFSGWRVMGTGAAVGFGIAVAAAGIVGDLAASLLKRQAGAKDSGHLLPGMGGALDEIDDVLFAAPVGYLFLVLLDRLA